MKVGMGGNAGVRIFVAIGPYVDICALKGGKERALALWGMGRVGTALADELETSGIPFETFDAHKEGFQVPDLLQGQQDRVFVIVTMMQGYDAVGARLLSLDFVKGAIICAWQSLRKFGRPLRAAVRHDYFGCEGI